MIMETSERDVMKRRQLLGSLAVATMALAVHRSFAQAIAAASPSCALTPSQTEGPFFVDERLQRTDLRVDPRGGSVRPGVPLALALRVSALAKGRCGPLRNAVVDVWHCDARGLYSDTRDTPGTRFLRGFQRTDNEGTVHFETIYPGAYPGRAVHIHFKVRTDDRRELTSQLYFDDAVTDRVQAPATYAAANSRRTRDGEDFIYRRGGRELTLDVVARGDGFAATYDVGVRV
jgi:protocatechuate 3,4-dioxygenase beta subunit